MALIFKVCKHFTRLKKDERGITHMNIKVPEETAQVIQTFTGMSVIEFLEKTKQDILNEYQGKGSRMTVKQAAELMGVSEQFVRLALQRKELPFGAAVQMSSKWAYYISPKLFYEYVGVNPKE